MKVGSGAGFTPDWTSSSDAGITQALPGENLSQIASRLGISLADLQQANPQIADTNALTPGLEIQVPPHSQGSGTPEQLAGANIDGAAGGSSKHMENQLESSLMRSMLSAGGAPSTALSFVSQNNSPGGSGGVSQMPPVADPVGERAAQGDQSDLKDALRTAYSTAEHLGIHHEDIVSMLQTMAGNPPLTSEKLNRALHLFMMASDLSPGDRKLVDDAFQHSHGDPTQVEALSKLVADPKFTNASTQTKKDWLSKFNSLVRSPEVQNLPPDEKNIVTQALTSDPPPSADKISKTMDLIHTAKDLSPGDRQLFLDGLKAAGGDPVYGANLQKLIQDPKFKSLKPAEKTAVLSQTKNYSNATSVANIDRLIHKSWFQSESLDDKQRSLKTIGRLSSYATGDRQLIGNTLEKILGDHSPIKIQWKKYPTTGKGTTFGEMDDHNVLYLNKDKVPVGNGRVPEDDDSNHLELDTTSHEINHNVNHDEVANTFHYFESEYRAWYVGFKADHGRSPTNEEAMEQRISWQLDPDSFYGKYAAAAMKNPKEAQQFYHFLSEMTGMKVDAHNWKQAVNSDPATWPDKGRSPAPVPSGNLDNS